MEKALLQNSLKNIMAVSNEEKDTQIGLSNIKRSLKLWYGQENLFHISNAIPNGAQVEIRIPEEGEKMDESIDC